MYIVIYIIRPKAYQLLFPERIIDPMHIKYGRLGVILFMINPQLRKETYKPRITLHFSQNIGIVVWSWKTLRQFCPMYHENDVYVQILQRRQIFFRNV